MPEVTIPHKFNPRSYQREVFKAREKGIRFICLVWHRRAGKGSTLLNLTIREMVPTKEFSNIGRIGNYYYFLPTAVGARRNVWEAIGDDGVRFVDHFPRELIETKRDDQQFIRFHNGSTFQLIGSDDPDALRGPNPVGIVFDEYSISRKAAWDTVQPILAQNKGWAAFAFTPKGTSNHASELYANAKKSADWFCSLQTLDTTRRDGPGENHEPIILQSELDRYREEGTDEDFIQQEYYCSFAGHMVGSYYGRLMAEAERGGRISRVLWEPRLPVETAWDLGIGDATAIWFIQRHNREIRLIDYLEESGDSLGDYIRTLRTKPYVYTTHWAPHDIRVRELGSGKSRLEAAEMLGLRFEVVPNLPIDDGIAAVRALLPRCYFDSEKCKRGISRLMNYSRHYNEERKVFDKKPKHDENSHGADAFRYAALSMDEADRRVIPMQVETDFQVFN